MQKTVLVLGPNGSIGRAAARAFLAQGWRVLGLVRAGKSADAGILSVSAELFDAQAVARACGPVDVVFNGLNVPYPVWPQALLPTLTAAADIAEALDARHIYPGSAYNFGAHMPPVLTPDAPFAPTTIKGRLRVAAEAMFAERAGAGRLRTIVVRAGDFFGPQAGSSWMNALIGKDLKNGKLTGVGGYDTVHAWAYMPDLAEVIVRLAEVEGDLAAYEVFHFEGHNVSLRTLRAAGEKVRGRKVKLGRMPRFVFSVMGLFDPFMKAALEMLYLWDVPHALEDQRLGRVIGEVPKTPLDQALRYLVDTRP